MLCLDVWTVVMTFLNAREQLNLHSSCKEFNERLIISAVDNIKATDIILKQQKYVNITYLGATLEVTNINHLKKLTFLGPSRDISNEGISELVNITHLYIGQNKKIYQIKHLKKIKHLDMPCGCYIHYSEFAEFKNMTHLNSCRCRGVPSFQKEYVLTYYTACENYYSLRITSGMAAIYFST